jgi:four helix bundle protein
MNGVSDDQNIRKLVREYRDLEVYKMAFTTSLSIHKSSLEFPKIEQYALADQMRRASKSICANIAEGFAKQQS